MKDSNSGKHKIAKAVRYDKKRHPNKTNWMRSSHTHLTHSFKFFAPFKSLQRAAFIYILAADMYSDEYSI